MFTLGPLTFHVYGFILGLAITVSWTLVERILKRARISESEFSRIALIVVVSGIIGARLYHVVDYWWYYHLHLWEIVYLWQGGLGIWGAVVGGAVGLYAATLTKPSYRWLFVDSVCSVLPAGQAIGRWGNFVNHELFGQPTTLPWKLFIPPQFRPRGYEMIAYYHPLFLYESLLNSLLFIFLLVQRHRGIRPGSRQLTGFYLVGYGLIRFFLEPLRISPWRLGLLTTAQWVSLAMMCVGTLLILRVGLKHASHSA